MSKITSEIVDDAKEYVKDLLNDQLSEVCVFHSIDHTMDVFKNSQTIGKAIRLSENDINILGVAALFHDTGYVKSMDDHENFSCDIAREFLESKHVNEEVITQVLKSIIATRVPQEPEDIISMALCDADLMHLTFDDYFERMKPMREEWRLTGRADLSEAEFHRSSIEFFGNHTYHTEYGKEILAPKKKHTLDRIIKLLSEGH